MEIKTVGVIGAGTMGNGIAHVFARSGYEVVLVDIEQRFLDRGLETIRKNLEREVTKEKITAEARDAAIARITATVDRAKLAGCDFVVEAASERFEIKSELFRDLDQLCRPEVILCVEYVVDFDHETGGRNEASGQSHRDALLQPGAGDEAGRGNPRAGNLRRNLRRR